MAALSKNVWPILMILASVWGIWQYILPGYNDIIVLQTEKGQYEEAISNANEVTFRRGQLLESYNAVPKESWDRLEKLLPTEIDRVKLAADINGMAEKLGIRLALFNVDKETVAPGAAEAAAPVTGTPAGAFGGGDNAAAAVSPIIPTTPRTQTASAAGRYTPLSMTFGFDATYIDFTNLLRNIEKSLEFFDAMSIKVEPSASEDTNRHLYRFTVKLQTYWVK